MAHVGQELALGDAGDLGLDRHLVRAADGFLQLPVAFLQALLALQQLRFGAPPLVVGLDQGDLVGQLAGKRDFVGVPLARAAHVREPDRADGPGRVMDGRVEQRPDPIPPHVGFEVVG